MEEKRLRDYRRRIQQIDRILIPSIRSLVNIAHAWPRENDPLGETLPDREAVYFPPWVSDIAEAPGKSYLVTRSFCAATLLRIWRIRRRFLDLKKEGTLDKLKKLILPPESAVSKLESASPLNENFEDSTRADKRHPRPPRLQGTFVPQGRSFDECAKLLLSETYGALNPMTASQIFSVLMEIGERHAHGPLGFLAFFCMVWSMKRQFPPGVAGDGAQLEPWGPSAYVTAKCLLPIQTLQRVCQRRAELFREIDEALEELKKWKDDGDPYSQWRFASTLDGLSNTFFAVSRLSSAPRAMKTCGRELSKLADLTSLTDQELKERWEEIDKDVEALLVQARDEGDLASTPEKLSGSLRAMWRLCKPSTPRSKDNLLTLAFEVDRCLVACDTLREQVRGAVRAVEVRMVESGRQEGSGKEERNTTWPLHRLYGKVEEAVRWALAELGAASGKAAKGAGQVLKEVDTELVSWLEAMKMVWAAIATLEKRVREVTSTDQAAMDQLKKTVEEDISRLEQEVEKQNRSKVPPATTQLRELLCDENLRMTKIRDAVSASCPKEQIKVLVSTLKKDVSEQCECFSIGLKFPDEWSNNEEYWKDLHNAAREAWELCQEAHEKLAKISNLRGTASTVAEANEEMAEFFSEKFGRHVRWCRRVANRQIAHISAKNETAFSPSELVSAIAVAVRWKQMRSSLVVADAIKKAVTGARDDGSWLPGQPYYCEGRLLSVVPMTSDTVSTLATAITDYRDIEDADEAFERYVDWLDRTRSEIPIVLSNGADTKVDKKADKNRIQVSGWASDRASGPHRIDLWATTHSINALLEIRDLVEHRLWQMCERNFTVLQPRKGLSEIAPLDLNKPHEERLLCQLKREAPRVQGDDFEAGRYSFVLHGPPGSSKSSIAKALASDIWRSPVTEQAMEPQVVRITPADFTRLGESRLDSVARFVFELLENVRGVTVFFDEIDDLLHKRDPSSKPEFLKLVVPAMLNRLQDLREACVRQQICVVLATNYIEQIEPALLRQGRIDKCFPVVYPDHWSREAMFWRRELLKDGPPKSSTTRGPKRDREKLAKDFADKTRGLPWKKIDAACKEPETSHGLGERESLVTEPGYRKRCWPGPVSNELRDEACAYFKVRANGDCRNECRELAFVLRCPEKWRFTDSDGQLIRRFLARSMDSPSA